MNPGQFIQWQDLFVMVDDGTVPLARYGPIETAVREQAKAYPQGIAVLAILPADAKPPPDDVKRAVKNTLMRMAPSMSSLTYLIEGTGFRAVTVRATLVGMKIFSSRPYPIYVETSLREALSKMTQHMVNGHTISIEVVMKAIADARLMWQMPPPARPIDREMPLK